MLRCGAKIFEKLLGRAGPVFRVRCFAEFEGVNQKSGRLVDLIPFLSILFYSTIAPQTTSKQKKGSSIDTSTDSNANLRVSLNATSSTRAIGRQKWQPKQEQFIKESQFQIVLPDQTFAQKYMN